ncbi:MaoC family dehydratase [Neptunicella marina]|uniref:MaoC-like domain-containing protein n=1 Tax=Neptunicella marina TaxID=2125989 RepID=A0A8J6IVA9_9ALTE|nr:MaoC/PaaZ C-terminal domain-containing protein [Neptunicella marina]MBC3766879.1 hypothetical protein [Neptunicella marina]
MSLIQTIARMSKALFKRNQTSFERVLPHKCLELQIDAIDSEHLAGYNNCIGWQPEGVLSPTYLHVLASASHLQLLLESEQPFALLGLVHIANRIEQLRPVNVNECINLKSYLDNLQPHAKGWCFDIVTEACVSNQLVWREISTNLSRGKTHNIPKHPLINLPDELKLQAEILAPTNIGRRYARFSGDYNPIHLYPLLAKCLGFKRHIAHGMWSKARCLAELANTLPQQFSVTVNFTRPLFLPGYAALSYATRNELTSFELTSSEASHLRGSIQNLMV